MALAVKAGHPGMLVFSIEDPVLGTLVENLLQPRLDDSGSDTALLSELESEKHILEPQEEAQFRPTALLARLLASKGYPD